MWAAREQSELAPVPPWRLSPDRVALWKVLVVRGLEWVRAATLLLAAAGVAWLAWLRVRSPLAAAARLRPRPTAFAGFALLAILHTWPLAASPATLSRYDNSDAMLNEWTVAWVGHQIVSDPLHLFDANIFFPERNTLAYSEAMLVQGVLGAPLVWLGAPTLLVYNLVLLAGFTLTGWATAWSPRGWTGSWAAGAAAGIVAAFNAHMLTRLPHMQALHVEFLPLALAALDTLLRDPKPRHALKLALWFVLQALTSVYLLVFSAFAMIAAVAARPRDWTGRRFVPAAACLALAAGVSVLVLWPYLQPYWQVHTEQGIARTLFDVELYSASWKDYLSTPSRVHYNAWSYRWFTGAALFPGLMAMALAAVAIARGIAWRDPRARMCLAVGVCGVLLSFGIKLPGYETLYHLLPPLQAVRAVSRFGYLGTMAIGFLAAFGLVELRRRFRWAQRPSAAAALLAVLRRRTDGGARSLHAVCRCLDDLRIARVRTTRGRRRAADAGRVQLVRQREVHDQLDAALAADAQRLQRLRAGEFLRARPRTGHVPRSGGDCRPRADWRDARVRSGRMATPPTSTPSWKARPSSPRIASDEWIVLYRVNGR